MSYIDCEKCIHYQICCGYTSKEAIAESNRAMNNGESLLCFMYKPTADVVEVRHGEWISKCIAISSSGFEWYMHTCSNCGDFYKTVLPNGYKYCHNCGAKMDGERKESDEKDCT